MSRTLFIPFFCLLLSACGAGPDSQTLRQHIQQQLVQQFGKERITLLTLERRGSQPASISARDGHIVYFKAALRLSNPTGLNPQEQQTLSRILSAGVEGLEIEGQDIIANGLSWNVWNSDHWQMQSLEPTPETDQTLSSVPIENANPACVPQVTQSDSQTGNT
jgi:hypothetical protein